MKPFRFQQFQILQDAEVFRVGTDGVLLGALADVINASSVLEVGTGTGLISLMLAQRNAGANFIALDINPTAAALATANFHNSPFSNRMTVLHQDFKNFEPKEKFDLIACNPPYFKINGSQKDVLARQTVELDWRLLLKKSVSLLSDIGKISVIIPSESSAAMLSYGSEIKLYLQRIIHVYGVNQGPLKRNILEFSLQPTEPEAVDFVIEKSPRIYSNQYLEATKDFHVFGKA